MPTVKLDRKIFDRLVGKKLPLEMLKNRISYLGTDLEEADEKEINVEIFPNRPDLLSEAGFARAFSTFIGVKKGLKEYSVKNSGKKLIIDQNAKEVRPYTVCAIIKDIDLDNEKLREIIQIQEKLHITYGRNRKKCAIGIYPLDKIEFPIRFMAKKPEDIKFVPLGSDKVMTGAQILSKHDKGKEFAHLLAGFEKFPIFIDAKDNILSMPPIINSESVGKVDAKTRNIFIECSGHHLNTLKICLNIIVCALSDLGGKIESIEISAYSKKYTTPDLSPEKMKIDIDYVNKVLGLKLKENDIKKYLEQMGFGYKNKEVLIPAYRADILHQIDFTEDIAIAYGYENFKAEIPKVSTIAKETPVHKFENKIANILVGLKLIEVMNYHLIEKNKQTVHMRLDEKKTDPIILASCASEEYNTLRQWLIPSLFETYNSNKHNEYPQNIFEIGRVFKKDKTKESKVEEKTKLAVSICNDDADFTRIKQIFDSLFEAIDIKYEMKEYNHESFIVGRCAKIIVDKKEIGMIGEMHPEVMKNWGIEMPVCAFELDINGLFELLEKRN